MLSDFLSSNPEIIAVLIAVAGVFLAGLLARLTERWMMTLDSYLRRRAPTRLEHLDLRALREALRGVVYYGILAVFLIAALQTLSVSVVQEWLGILLQYVPQLILGGLIILTGYLVGVVLRNLLAGLMGLSTEHLVPRMAQVLVVIAAVLTGLAQTSIDISFISDVVVILLAFFFGGLSLAFALGSRQLVENLLARRALDRYHVGDRVRVNGIDGMIVEILGTAVVLESGEGTVTVPAARFMESEVLLVNVVDASDNGGRPD